MINENDILDEMPGVISEDITPRDMLKLAKSILLMSAILFILGGIAELIKPNCGIFESCKTILPPIVTLVIGFYFGKSN